MLSRCPQRLRARLRGAPLVGTVETVVVHPPVVRSEGVLEAAGEVPTDADHDAPARQRLPVDLADVRVGVRICPRLGERIERLRDLKHRRQPSLDTLQVRGHEELLDAGKPLVGGQGERHRPECLEHFAGIRRGLDNDVVAGGGVLCSLTGRGDEEVRVRGEALRRVLRWEDPLVWPDGCARACRLSGVSGPEERAGGSEIGIASGGRLIRRPQSRWATLVLRSLGSSSDRHAFQSSCVRAE